MANTTMSHLQLERAAGHGHRAAAARGVGLAQFHALAAHGAHVVVGVAQQFERAGQPVEIDTFLLRVVDLLGPRRRFGCVRR
jgi:hypothetical protein